MKTLVVGLAMGLVFVLKGGEFGNGAEFTLADVPAEDIWQPVSGR